MGVWDEYCLICAGPLHNPFKKGGSIYDSGKMVKINKTNREYNWLNDLFLITSEEKILKTKGSDYNDSGSFIIEKKKYIITPANWHSEYEDNEGYGIICHQDCYNYLNINFNYELHFSDICRNLSEFNCLLKSESKYGVMKKYLGQDFDYFNANENNSWLLMSPLKNKENASRITKIWKPLIESFKRNPPRPSPCESATNFKVGTILTGFDKRKWIVVKVGVTNKWQLYNENKVVNKNYSKKNSKKIVPKMRSRRPSKKRRSKSRKKRKTRRKSKG